MKKVLGLALVLMLVLAVAAGCTPANQQLGDYTEDGRPIITIGVPKHPAVTTFGDDNTFTAWVEELSGCEIVVVEFAYDAVDYSAQIATRIASGQELPDILMNFNFSDKQRNDYGQQGYFMDLKPYYDDKEKSENFWISFDEYLTQNDKDWFYHKIEDSKSGGWYALPYFCPGDQDTIVYQPWINQNWLDALNLEVPTNKEELEYVLRQFRDRDPNGNGKKDEIPLMGTKSNMGGNALYWLINMYDPELFVDFGNYVNITEDGTVYAPCVTDKYRDALRWVNMLMEEKLVHETSLTNTNADLKRALATGDMIGVAVGHPTTILPKPEDMEKWTVLPQWGNCYYEDIASRYCNYITTDCSNPDAAWKVMMALCDYETILRGRFGEEGYHWDYADEGAKTAFGDPATIKLYIDVITEAQTNATWNAGLMGVSPKMEMDQIQVSDNMPQNEWDMYAKTKEQIVNYREQVADTKSRIICVPRLMWTDELKRECEFRTDVTNCFATSCSKFVKGVKGFDVDNDADWQKYLNELKTLTYDTWIVTVQKVVDTMIAKGQFVPETTPLA